MSEPNQQDVLTIAAKNDWDAHDLSTLNANFITAEDLENEVHALREDELAQRLNSYIKNGSFEYPPYIGDHLQKILDASNKTASTFTTGSLPDKFNECAIGNNPVHANQITASFNNCSIPVEAAQIYSPPSFGLS